MTENLVSELIGAGAITQVHGKLETIPRCAIVIWAKHEPRHDNLPLIALAKLTSTTKVTIYVDDLAARILHERSLEEQESINSRYLEFFLSKNCNIRFSSEIYKQIYPYGLLPALVELSKKIPLSGFLRYLPEKKKNDLESLRPSELLNALFELLLFEEVKKEFNTLVLRHFTQGILMLHRKISNSPLNAFVLPKLNSVEEIEEFLIFLEQF